MKEVLALLRMRSFRKSICIQTKNMLIITESYPLVKAVTRISNIDTSAPPSLLTVLPERPHINKFTYIFLIFSSTFGLFPKILDILSRTDILQGLYSFHLASASTPALPVPVTAPPFSESKAANVLDSSFSLTPSHPPPQCALFSLPVRSGISSLLSLPSVLFPDLSLAH